MSANELMLDVSQAHELKMAFRRSDWTNADIKVLSEGDLLAEVLKVIRGQSEIKPTEHLIDTDAAPLIEKGWSIESHIGHGFWKCNLKRVELFLSKEQKKNDQNGGELRKIIEALKDKKALNANVLDYLLAHPELIPRSWKGTKSIFFWGTIYRRDDNGNLYVRYLRWDGSGWCSRYGWLDVFFYSEFPAAISS